jgi:hypothetical protein
VSGEPGLAADDDIIADDRAAGYADLGDNEAVLADDDVVADLTQISQI